VRTEKRGSDRTLGCVRSPLTWRVWSSWARVQSVLNARARIHLTIEYRRVTFEGRPRGDHPWTEHRRPDVGQRPVTWVWSARGQSNDSLSLALYKYGLAGPRLSRLSLSWHFDILDILLISILDSSLKWNWEWFLVHLLEWLYLVALGDRCGYGVLVTLCGCHHLDGLEQRRNCGKSWWLFLAISWWLWGVLVPSPGRAQKTTLVDCACHWATSLVSRFLRCPSGRTTKCWSTQRGLACWQAHKPREKIMCLHCDCFIGFLPVIGLLLIVIGSFLDAAV
jgi:hypothetical protein